MILILISLTIGGYEIDSLKNLVHPLLVKKRAELLNENPDYRKYFNPYNGYGYGRSKFSDEYRDRQQK